jgi:two-component system cell cycle sensor histidine kinase/response regulator CckA
MSMSRRTILVVDDEEPQRALMRGILHQEAYGVLEASDYRDALAVQQRHLGEIDLLLIDLSLPGGNGYDLSKALRAVEPHLRVIFVSGHAGAELRKFFDAPVTDIHFLQKPFRPAALLMRVKSVLESADPLAGSVSAH